MVKVEGVYNASADGTAGTATVSYDANRTTPQRIATALSRATRYEARAP